MTKKCVLISGPTIACDKELQGALQKRSRILTSSNNDQIESIIKRQKVDLILMEMQQGNKSDIDLIKHIKCNFPEIAIVVIDGEQEKLAEAFNCGAEDAFRKPYDAFLLAERVEVLIK